MIIEFPNDSENGTKGDNALEAFEKLGLVGCIQDGPDDLASNPKHMKSFGKEGTA